MSSISSEESWDHEREGPGLSESYPARRAAWLAELAETDEFKILSKLSQHNTIVADVVQQIVSRTSVAISENTQKFHRHRNHLSQALLEIVQETLPPQQSPFVEFLAQLKEVVVVDPITGKTFNASHCEEDFDVWREFPVFGRGQIDVAESKCNNMDAWNPKNTFSSKQMIENGNAFWAQLMAAGHCFFQGFALRACCRAFENGPPTRNEEGVLDTCAIRAACQYFIYAADRMWADVQEELESYVPEGPEYHVSSMGDDVRWTGFNHERWTIWEQKLKDALDDCEDGQDTKTLIEGALAQIARVDTKKDF